jgi:hypothetical protein
MTAHSVALWMIMTGSSGRQRIEPMEVSKVKSLVHTAGHSELA